VGGCHGFFHVACCLKSDVKSADEMPRKANKLSRKRKQRLLLTQKKDADEQSLIKVQKRLEGTVLLEKVKTEPVSEESLVEEENLEQALVGVVEKDQFKCNECADKEPRKCFVCHNDKNQLDLEEERVKCSVTLCGKFYHITCKV
jgi:hypothetical protein